MTFANLYRLFYACIIVFCGFGSVTAQTLSPNGFSGLGVLPSAKTLPGGDAVLAFDSTMPGAPIAHGYNTQIGFGLTDNLELVGRLATNDQKCNMFKMAACPNGTFRDFSSSMKWRLPIDWLTQNNASLAIGATDFGGAATYFRSYYAVASKSFDHFDVSLGQGKGKVPSSILDGSFASATWRPASWAQMSLQRVGPHTTAHALLQAPIGDNGSSAWLTFNQRLSNAPVMEKSWVGWGVSMPLDRVGTKVTNSSAAHSAASVTSKQLPNLNPSDLLEALEGKGFYNPKIGRSANGKLWIELENTAYVWNVLDAAGVALGVISAAYAKESKDQEFELVLTNRGIRQVKVQGQAQCVGRWLIGGEVCNQLQIKSLLQRNGSQNNDQDPMVNWTGGSAWSFRPELIVSPTIVSTIGTEYGSFDFDLGANLNLVLPLWPGALIETNQVKPVGVGTQNFERGGLFYGSRLKPVTNRTLFHQLINLPSINTQARLSSGTAYAVWDGQQIETSTQSDNGRHKFSFTSGSFKTDTLVNFNQRDYNLVNYRFANNGMQTQMTEITKGKFWGGDKGFSINQRFWHGDTTLNIYFRRTRMSETQPLVSFAGVQIAIPFTPRENKSLAHFGLRGVSQWTYTLETKVLERENFITGGYGEVPKVGDSLVSTFNRDRNSTRYLESNLIRTKSVFNELSAD
jgi:hypothetical protein